MGTSTNSVLSVCGGICLRLKKEGSISSEGLAGNTTMQRLRRAIVHNVLASVDSMQKTTGGRNSEAAVSLVSTMADT